MKASQSERDRQMKLRIARLGVLIATVMGLMVTMTPAEATTVKIVTFTGTATVQCGGLAYPGVNMVVPATTTAPKAGPKGEPEVNTTVHNGNTCDFVLASTLCVKLSLGKKTGVDNCTIVATGTVTGFCGLSSGLGTAMLTNNGPVIGGGEPTKDNVGIKFKFSSTATTLRVSGGNTTENIHGVVSAVPLTGSCTNTTATGFLITGEVVVKDIT